MNSFIKSTLEEFIKESLKKLEINDIKGLKKNVEKIIHSITIFREDYLIDLFIYFYSLGKIFEILEIKKPGEKYKIKDKLEKFFMDFGFCLEKEDINCIKEKIKEIKKIVKSYEIVYSEYYLEKIEEKARAKLGFLLYKHGISLKEVSELLKIDLPKIQKYVGSTNLIYDSPTIYDISKRIKKLINLLKNDTNRF